MVPKTVIGEAPEVSIGDARRALQAADVSVDQVYRTPWYNHNAIEPHATLALWTADDRLSVFDSTQSVARLAATMADVFSLKPKNVEILSPFVGGGFGGKGGMWQHTVLAAAAARLFQRPVRVELSREQVYRIVGGRTRAEQRVARRRLEVQSTEVAEQPQEPQTPAPGEGNPPEPARIPEPYPPPDEGNPPQPAIIPEPGPAVIPEPGPQGPEGRES